KKGPSPLRVMALCLSDLLLSLATSPADGRHSKSDANKEEAQQERDRHPGCGDAACDGGRGHEASGYQKRALTVRSLDVRPLRAESGLGSSYNGRRGSGLATTGHGARGSALATTGDGARG